MKKAVFGGFCLLAGVLLFCLSFLMSSFDGEAWVYTAMLAGVPLAVFGLILGLMSLKENK